MFKRILSWFRKDKPQGKPQVKLIPYEVTEPGQRSKWAVDVVVNDQLKVTKWFPKKPTKRQLQELSKNH